LTKTTIEKKFKIKSKIKPNFLKPKLMDIKKLISTQQWNIQWAGKKCGGTRDKHLLSLFVGHYK
jgi:hypothetical protein